MLTCRVKQKRLTQAAKCKVANSPRLFFGQARLQRGSYLKASDEDHKNVLDVAVKLILIRLRRCRRMELAHYFCETEGTKSA